MKSASQKLSREDVLEAFALESNHDRLTLEKYFREFPQYAAEIANLSHEISRAVVKPAKLSANDVKSIEASWKQFSSATSLATVDLLAVLSVPEQRKLAEFLGVPRQIITAFREHRVIVSSIPRSFLARIATALNTGIEQVLNTLSMPTQISCASSKADEKPVAAPPSTFEQLLIDAQVSVEKRSELMTERK